MDDLKRMNRMERGVIIFHRAITMLQSMCNLSDEEIAAVIETAKQEIDDEFPKEDDDYSEG